MITCERTCDRSDSTYLCPALLINVYQHTLESYPDECCGLIIDHSVRRCLNRMDELHRLDPVGYPRSGRTGFCFSHDDIFFLERTFESDHQRRIIYHSHPNGRSYLSEDDLRTASLYRANHVPSLTYLVVGVKSSRLVEAALFDCYGMLLRRYPISLTQLATGSCSQWPCMQISRKRGL